MEHALVAMASWRLCVSGYYFILDCIVATDGREILRHGGCALEGCEYCGELGGGGRRELRGPGLPRRELLIQKV